MRRGKLREESIRYREALLRYLFRTGVASQLIAPTDVYGLAFLRVVDARIVRSVQRLFYREARAIAEFRRIDLSKDERERLTPDERRRHHFDAPGYIYAFHNPEHTELSRYITVPSGRAIKVGRTIFSPQKRLSEWKRDLDNSQLQELFSVKTSYNEFAEAVIHAVLTCERLNAVINAQTGAELREFFQISSVISLKFLVAYVVHYCDAFGDVERAKLVARHRAQQRR